jgi:hypothetical protein
LANFADCRKSHFVSDGAVLDWEKLGKSIEDRYEIVQLVIRVFIHGHAVCFIFERVVSKSLYAHSDAREVDIS